MMYGGNTSTNLSTYGEYHYPRIVIYVGGRQTDTSVSGNGGGFYSPPTTSALEIEAFARNLRYWSEGQARRNAIAPLPPPLLRSVVRPPVHPGMVHRMRCPARTPRRTFRSAA